MLENKKLGFIGVGNMATAMINGIFNFDNSLKYENLYLNDIDIPKLNFLRKQGANISDSSIDVVKNCDYVVLSVKPQNFPDLLAELKSITNISNKIFISIAAGIKTEYISDALGGALVVRALPNTPMLIGMGVSVICKNDNINTQDFDNICSIFKASGNILIIDESQMNEIISVTSSSPAYVFKLIEAMCNGAVTQGFDYNVVYDSICDVIIGAATLAKQLAKQSGKKPSELIAMVASKGGTTERALKELDAHNFEGAVMSAMEKCTARAYELGAKK